MPPTTNNAPHRVSWERKLWRGEKGGWAPSLADARPGPAEGSHHPWVPTSSAAAFLSSWTLANLHSPDPALTHKTLTLAVPIQGTRVCPAHIDLADSETPNLRRKKKLFSFQHTILVTYTEQLHQRQKQSPLPRSTLLHAKAIKHTPKKQTFTKSWAAIFPELWDKQPRGPQIRLPSLARHWPRTSSQLSSWPEMPGCFSARVPRQVCIAEDQREAGAGLGTGTGSSGRRPSQGWEHSERAGLLSGWGFLVVLRCAFGKPPTLMAKIAAHQYSGQGLDLPPQFQLSLRNNPASGDYFTFYRSKLPKALPPRSHPQRFKLRLMSFLYSASLTRSAPWVLSGSLANFLPECVPSCFGREGLCNAMDYSLPGSSVHGNLQARVWKWVARPSYRGSSRPRNQTCLLQCWQILYHWGTGKA